MHGRGKISRSDFYQLFQAYFEISMELVRKSVKLIEESMLDQFNDQDPKPVSAAFGAPSTLDVEENFLADDAKQDLDFGIGRPTTVPVIDADGNANLKEYGHGGNTMDLRPSLAFMDNDENLDSISKDAINEMIDQIFINVGKEGQEFLDFDDFKKAVDIDLNILAWIETLGSVF